MRFGWCTCTYLQHNAIRTYLIFEKKNQSHVKMLRSSHNQLCPDGQAQTNADAASYIARAVADVLSAPQGTNKFYRADLIAEIVNFVDRINDDNHLTGKIIAKMFAGDGGDDYEINYDDIELGWATIKILEMGIFYASADELS